MHVFRQGSSGVLVALSLSLCAVVPVWGDLPLVINTWAVNGFQNATDHGFDTLAAGGTALDAVETGQPLCPLFKMPSNITI